MFIGYLQAKLLIFFTFEKFETVSKSPFGGSLKSLPTLNRNIIAALEHIQKWIFISQSTDLGPCRGRSLVFIAFVGRMLFQFYVVPFSSLEK